MIRPRLPSSGALAGLGPTSTTLGSSEIGGTPPPPEKTPIDSAGLGTQATSASDIGDADLITLFPAQPQVTASSSRSYALTAEMPVAATIGPQEGLMVAFATLAESFEAQLLAAVALGVFGSVLILAVPKRDADSRTKDTLEPGSWWFTG